MCRSRHRGFLLTVLPRSIVLRTRCCCCFCCCCCYCCCCRCESNIKPLETQVWDLNADPRLPFDDATYDAVVCTVSVQYLQQPEAVFADVRRVLK